MGRASDRRSRADIGNAVKPFHGDAAGAHLTALLRGHILTAADWAAGPNAGAQRLG